MVYSSSYYDFVFQKRYVADASFCMIAFGSHNGLDGLVGSDLVVSVKVEYPFSFHEKVLALAPVGFRKERAFLLNTFERSSASLGER